MGHLSTLCSRQCKEATISITPLVKRAFDELDPLDKGQFVYEAAWRHETFFVPVLDWLQELFRETILNDACWTEADRMHFAALVMLRTAREDRKLESFAKWEALLAAQKNLEPEIATNLVYQRCLWARDELNFQVLKDRLALLDGSDPLWELRRAALLCEVGDIKSARRRSRFWSETNP